MDNSEEKCAQVRPLLKAGQVWIDRSGDKVTIADCPVLGWHRYPYLGFVARDVPLRAYNENGWRVNEDDSGPSYLVRLYEGSDRDEVDENPERELCWRCKGIGVVAIGERKWAICPDCNDHNDESKESTIPDISKPVRRKISMIEVSIIGPMSDGRIVCEYQLFGVPQYSAYHLQELENIPEPKRTMSRDMAVIEGWDTIYPASHLADDVKVLALARIIYTEGEGWSIGEVKS